MKRRFIKLFSVIAMFCLAIAMFIGIGDISTASAEGESTLSISLIGNSTIYLQKGTEYKEFGATAYDTIEGDLTENIVINNPVNKDTVGTYTVSYSVSNGYSKTATTSRTVEVFDSFVNETLRFTNSVGSTSNNTYNKILRTSDGGYVVAGTYSSSAEIYATKYNNLFEVEWGKGCGYSYSDVFQDMVIDCNDNLIVLYSNANYQINGQQTSFIAVFDKNGNIVQNKQYATSGACNSIVDIGGDEYLLFKNSSSYCKWNRGDDSIEKIDINDSSIKLNKAEILNKNAIVVSNKGVFTYNLITNKKQEFLLENNANSYQYKIVDGYIYCVYQFDDFYIFYRFDENLEIINSGRYSGFAGAFDVSDNILVLQDTLASNTKYCIFDIELKKIEELYINRQSFYTKDILIDNGDIYLVGQYLDFYATYYANTYAGVLRLSDILLFKNTLEYRTTVSEEIDFYNDVDICDSLGNSLGTYTCDYSQVDITKAGNYKAYYTFTAIDDAGIKTYYVGRDIIVEPTTTFEDGEVYSGSKVVDVESGSVTINSEEYSYGDVYNVPGTSKMVITGENGYTKTINFTIELIVEGVENNTTYYTEVVPVISGGEITLDGQPYVSETPITTKGHHTLVITGANGFRETINFTIETTIVGVADGQTYTETLYPDINGENMTLNGVAYSNEPIENCGNYTLTITGTNGYSKTITFVIETVISDLTNGETYDEEVTPSFTKGTATLNGEEYISGTTIYTPGVNTLVITGENGYFVTYTFTIVLGIENIVDGETYIGEVTPIISGGTITLNGAPYVSGTKIDVPGNYTITVLGAAGYRKDIHFIVKPYEVNVEHGAIYNHSVIPTVSNGTLTLNGEPYTSGSILNTSGEYTLVIIGENGYYESITFTLITGANIEDGMHYNDAVTLKFVGTATLNGDPVQPDTVIEKVGNYELVLTDGENTYTYNFVIEPDYSIFDGRITSCIIDFKNCTTTLNGESVTERTIINKVGNYSITVVGENGYSKTIAFAICAEVNVENGGEYSAGLVVNAVGGTIKLNGADFIDGTILSDVGTYILAILGENGHTETITFDIIPEINDINDATAYYGAVTPSIIGGTLTLNGEEYTSGTTIYTEGVYQLAISGVGGYAKTINFIVLSEDFEIQANSSYMEAMSITHNVCDMEINGVPYTIGASINTLGKNTLSFIYNGERTDIIFYIFPPISGVEEGQSYVGTATPIVDWSNLLLDGKVYTSGTAITEVGHHTLTIANLNGYNYEIRFTVTEVWENIEAGGRYEYSVTPKTNNGTLYLDGKSFSSGTTVYTVGHHTIKLIGVNGYESETTFTVVERMNNLVAGKEYTGSTYASVSNVQKLYLDDKSYSSGSNIYNVGYHTLRVEGVNGYTSEYEFTILPTINGAKADTEYYPGNTYITCNYSTIKVNGETWSNGATVYNVGYYTVEIIGTNDYLYTYEFTIIPSISGAQDDGEYSSYTYVSCSYATLKLNGDSYSSGTHIYDIGYHEVEIIGVNGYSKVISFTRTEGTSVVDGEEINYSKSVSIDYLSNFTNTIVKLDGEDLTSSKTIYTIGYHTLTIEGVNGYKVEKTFTIKANWSGVSDGTSYSSKTGTYLRLRSSNSSSSVLSEEYYTKILLDGENFTNNTYIYILGNHKFEIHGANGYVEYIEFTINPVIDNLYDVGSFVAQNDRAYPFAIEDNVYTSTNKAHNSVSAYTLTARVDVKVDFGYYVSSESGYDKLRVFLNGTEILTKSGSVAWSSIEITLNKDDVLQIQYSKDGSASNGEDCIKFRINSQSEGVGTKIIPIIYFDNTSTFEQNADTYVLLDGQPYELNTTIDTVGYHTITIIGVGSYQKEYKITVLPNISNIADDEIYSGSVTPNVSRCELLLDGEPYTSGTPIIAVGNHTLEMLGVNGYVLSYNFTIVPLNVEDYSDKVFYKEVAVNTIKNAILYLDGELYDGEKITTLGYHTIKIEGANGYEQTFNFSITENPILKDVSGYKDFVDGFTSEYMVNITIPNAELFIDGAAYTSGIDYYTVGLHYLRIVGENGYEAEYTFTITERINGLINGQTYSNLKLNCENIESMQLNGVMVSNLTEINLVGNYTLVVIGTNGYTSEYSFTIGLNLKNVENEGVYNSAIAPIVNAKTIYLNGVPFSSGETVSNVGYHSMRIEGVGGYVNEIAFTIEAKVEGVTHNSIYTMEVCPKIDSAQILLNGQRYTSGTVISLVGYHKIQIIGLNGYEKTISFTIKDNVQGITNGATYQENVIPTFNMGTSVTLDGEAFTSGTPILSSNIGIHKLKIIGVGGYEKEYVFTIIPTIENIIAGGKYQGSVSPVINAGSFKLNGQAITLDDPISTIGHNKLTIYGTNGYVQEISFTIEPVIENLVNSYQQSFTPDVIGSGMTMKLNGKSYNKGTKIETVGNNQLVVSGYGGYTKTFTITIVPLVTGVENNSEAYGSVQINAAPNATLTIDGASYTNNAVYTKVGRHTLKITGVNGYEQTLAFTLKENSSIISAEEYSGAFKLPYNKNDFGILIDGANYSSNTNYYVIGHHELMVVGSNGYTSSYSITVTPVLSGVEDKGEYNEKVSITTENGKIYIDDVLYSAGNVYKKVGNHTLKMLGTGGYEFSLIFTISPNVTGIAEGGLYSNTASWAIPSDCTAKLDGVSVAVNSSTAKIGNHTIEISGANGYQTAISFTVTETVNITDGEEYNKVITIDIPDCTAFLNDLEISDLYELNTPGSYTLTVFGTNGYTSEYKFTVISVLSGITDGQKYDGSLTANTSIGQWYLDDQPYVSGTLITEIGHHTLKVSGPEYEQVCSFTITVDVSAYANNLKTYNYTDTDLELYINGEKYTAGAKFNQVGNHTVEYRGANGYVSSADFTIEYTYNGNSDYKYKDSAVIDIPNATLYVNGTQIENLTEINSIGNNIITIKGANGYEKTVEIFIAPTLTIEDGEVRSKKFEIKKLNATMYLDGVAISEDTIVDTHGTHTLKIEGANGYVQEITFTFDNPNNDYVIMISVLVGLAAAAFVVMIILRKKVL